VFFMVFGFSAESVSAVKECQATTELRDERA
jgi:hypothetical protein